MSLQPIAIEHKGKLYMPRPCVEKMSVNELWYVAKGYQNCKNNVDELYALARVYKCKQMGCKYPPHIEEKVAKIQDSLYVKDFYLKSR